MLTSVISGLCALAIVLTPSAWVRSHRAAKRCSSNEIEPRRPKLMAEDGHAVAPEGRVDAPVDARALVEHAQRAVGVAPRGPDEAQTSVADVAVVALIQPSTRDGGSVPTVSRRRSPIRRLDTTIASGQAPMRADTFAARLGAEGERSMGTP